MVGPILWGVRPDFQSPFDSGKHFLGSPSAKICSALGGFENFGGPRLIWLASLITLVIDIGSTNPLKGNFSPRVFNGWVHASGVDITCWPS